MENFIKKKKKFNALVWLLRTKKNRLIKIFRISKQREWRTNWNKKNAELEFEPF